MAIIIRREPKNARAARVVAFDANNRFIWRGPVRECVMDCVDDINHKPANTSRSFIAMIAFESNFFEDDCFNEITE